jgi:hypothetical protein
MRRHREASGGAGLEDPAPDDAAKSDEVSPAIGADNEVDGGADQSRAQGDGKQAELPSTLHAPKLPPYGSLAEAFGYVVFLVVFVVATAVLDEDPQAFFFANRMSAALSDQLFAASMQQAVVGSSSAASDGVSTLVLPPVSLSGIHDQTQAWAFLTGPFLDVVYSGADANSVLAGGVVMRTLRVSPGSCPALDTSMPEYSSAMPVCYGAFSRDSEQTSSFGQVVNAADVSASAAYQFAIAFFEDKPSPHKYADLQTCLSQCGTACGSLFGSVDAFRYAELCAADCNTHCTCVYEQPAGFTSLCVDPNPNGAGAPVPDLVYPFNWVAGAGEYTPFGSTPTGAYIVMLDTEAENARASMTSFQQLRMLDLATRVLVVDLVLFNSYLRLFNAVKLAFEFPPTGGARVSLTDVAVRVFRYSSTSSSGVVARITLEAMVLAYIAWRWKCMVVALYRARGLRSLIRSSKWHAVSLTQLLAFSLWIALRLYESDLVYGIFSSTTAIIDEVRAALLSSSTPSSPAKPPNLLSLAVAQYAERVVGGVCAAVSWLKLLQYSTMFRRSHVLLRSLARAAPDLLWFLTMFVACVCAFAQIGVLLFGLDLFAFRSLGVAIPTMFHAVAGAGGSSSLDYEMLKASHPALGPLFYIGYYLLLLLIVVNVFWAIVSDAYAQTLAEQEEDDEDQQQDGADAKSEVVMDSGGDGDRALALATDAARREMEQLRRYPFSQGLQPAMRMLVVDIRRALYELRTGRKFHLTKVDPLVSVVLGSTSQLTTRTQDMQSTHMVASRKLDRHVRGHVERELLRLEHKMRVTRQVEEQQTQINALRASLETDVGERLAALAESNERKAARLSELESALGAIEGLCRQLVTDTAFLRADDSPNAASDGAGKPRRSAGRLGTATSLGLRAGTPPRSGSPAVSTGSGVKKTAGKNQSLSAAILANRQRELTVSGSRRKADGAGEEIEEISL